MVKMPLKKHAKADDSSKNTDSVESLRKKRQEISDMINSLEESRNEGMMTEDTYREVSEKNRKMLVDIDAQIAKISGGGQEQVSPAAGAAETKEPEKKEKPAETGPKKEAAAPDEKEKSAGGAPAAMETAARAKAQAKEKPVHGKEHKPEKKEQSKPEAPLPENYDELVRQKEEVESLLASLEDAYNEAAILEDNYNEIRAKNTKRLGEIKDKLSKMAPPPVQPYPAYPSSMPLAERTIIMAQQPSEMIAEAKKEKATLLEEMQKIEKGFMERFDSYVEKKQEGEDAKRLNEAVTQVARFSGEIDRMKTYLESVKENKKVIDDKIQRLAEGIAEVRASLYQREATMKEHDVIMRRLQEAVEVFDPAKISLRMQSRDGEINTQNIKIEKFERSILDMSNVVKRIQTAIQDIGSLENVVSVSRKVSEKHAEMERMINSMQKTSDKVSGIYVELSKKLDEFAVYKVKQDRVDALSKELMRAVEDIGAKMGMYATKEDIVTMKDVLKGAAPSQSSVVPAAAGESPEREEIEALLKTLEEEYKSNRIGREEYEKARAANMKRLESPAGPAPQSPRPAMKKTSKSVEREEPEPVQSDDIFAELEHSFRAGLISREAYEKTKKLLLG
jgi:hypothetical protein